MTRFNLPKGPKPPTAADRYLELFPLMMEGQAYTTPNRIMARRTQDAGKKWLKKNGHGGVVCRCWKGGETYTVHFDRSMEDI